MGLTVEAAASIHRLAATLSPLVTNGNIDAVARELGLTGSGGTNKTERIRQLLSHVCSDSQRRSNTESVVLTLTMLGHSRATDGKVVMTHAHVDGVVAEMRRLGLDPGQLAQRRWRTGLKDEARTERPSPAVASPSENTLDRSSVRPVEHLVAYRHIQELTRPDANPHLRGRQLEDILFDVLRIEGLRPERHVVIPDEEIDLAFVLDAQHYLVECKWSRPRAGFLISTSFRERYAPRPKAPSES